MKTLKYFLGAWLAVLAMQAFVGCSSDDPVEDEPGIEQGGGTGTDDDGKEEGGGNDDGKEDDEELTESAYKPFVTDKRISKVVEERFFYGNYSGQRGYTIYELSYDAKGRLKEYVHYILHKKGSEVTSQDTSLYRMTYTKNKIITHITLDISAPDEYYENVIELNEYGYDDRYSYKAGGYLSSSGTQGNTNYSYDKNGNKIKWTTSAKANYYCTYTDYKNDASIEINLGGISIPSDLHGKRCANLPEAKQYEKDLGTPYGDFYNYTFDSKGRLTEMEVVTNSVWNGKRTDKIYHFTYEE